MMTVKEMSITTINFDDMNPSDVFKWLEQFGFWRYVSEQYIIPQKSVDPRLIEPDESLEGLYPGIIVPKFNLHEAVFVIRRDLFYKIKETFQNSSVSNGSETDA